MCHIQAKLCSGPHLAHVNAPAAVARVKSRSSRGQGACHLQLCSLSQGEGCILLCELCESRKALAAPSLLCHILPPGTAWAPLLFLRHGLLDLGD